MSPTSSRGSYADPQMPSHAFLLAAFLPAVAAVVRLALESRREAADGALEVALVRRQPVEAHRLLLVLRHPDAVPEAMP